jgi:hypothetical protein
MCGASIGFPGEPGDMGRNGSPGRKQMLHNRNPCIPF